MRFRLKRAMNTPSRVAIIDDHALFRTGLRATLQAEEFVTVGEASDAKEGLELVALERPDVLIVDVGLPSISGISVLREALRTHPQCHVLVLTMHRSITHAAQAFDAGARGYAVKDGAAADILKAVREVARGAFYVDPGLPRWLLDPRDRVGAGGRLDKLSSREREVLDLIVRGFSNEAAARELGISIKTLETHRAKINRKLYVHSPAELMRFAAMHGLLGQVA